LSGRGIYAEAAPEAAALIGLPTRFRKRDCRVLATFTMISRALIADASNSLYRHAATTPSLAATLERLERLAP